ncbi:hypothetical protein BDY24DRAFT_403232 [Mrakia frigida]|uniref:uncharacterized protein n=1 Tax=Mrakia frigida TaxID=29902 RepID=UPI003FCBFA79
MRVNTRLLGQALGLSRPSTSLYFLRQRLPPSSIPHHRLYSSAVEDSEAASSPDPDDRLAKDVEKEEDTHAFADLSLLFPMHKNFRAATALEGEKHHYFPSSSSAPIPRTTEWPIPRGTQVASTKLQGTIAMYKQSYEAYIAIEKTVLAKSYERESVVLGAGEVARAERVRLDRLQKAEEEKALAEEARRARQEDVEDEALANRVGTRSPVTKELFSGRILAAVPWTTARFKISNALIADAFVELRGVDITGEAGGQDLDPETGMTAVEMEAWQKKWKRKSELERKKDRAAKKAAYTKETNKKMRESGSWLSLVFGGLPLDKLRLEDWNAAIHYYTYLEAEIKESQALPFRRDYRSKGRAGTADLDALEFLKPGFHYAEVQACEDSWSLDQFSDPEGEETVGEQKEGEEEV